MYADSHLPYTGVSLILYTIVGIVLVIAGLVMRLVHRLTK